MQEKLGKYAIERPVEVVVTDGQGKESFGVFVQQVTHPKTGDLYVTLNNASRDARTITLNPVQSGATVIDAITQQPLDSTIEMLVYDVRLIKIER